jgi:hypothetical protein
MVPWRDLDSHRASFIDDTCIPPGLTTLVPSSMLPYDIYTLYSHIVKIQDSDHAFKFKNDCEWFHNRSTPAPSTATLSLTPEPKEGTPVPGSQDNNLSDDVVDSSGKPAKPILEIGGDDIEVVDTAGTNTKCVYLRKSGGIY